MLRLSGLRDNDSDGTTTYSAWVPSRVKPRPGAVPHTSAPFPFAAGDHAPGKIAAGRARQGSVRKTSGHILNVTGIDGGGSHLHQHLAGRDFRPRQFFNT